MSIRLQQLDQPLAQLGVMITRPKAQASEMMSQLERSGASVYLYPTIEIQPVKDQSRLKHFLKSSERFDWLILTSINAIKILKQCAQAQGINLSERFSTSKIAVVGQQTATALKNIPLTADLYPKEAVAEQFAEVLIAAGIKDKSCLYLRAAMARDILKTQLEAAGAQFQDIVLYETLLPDNNDVARAAKALQNGSIHLVTFTSASSVDNFKKSFADYNLKDLLKHVQIASIGPITSAAAQKWLGRVDLEAREHSISGLIETLHLKAGQQ